MIALGMLVGAAVWLLFELIGVFTGPPERTDTTSQYVWAWERRWPWLRVLVAVFSLSLGAHLLWGTWLLP